MKILAIDTSTISCSVAVVASEDLLAESTIVREQTHSKHLMDMVHAVIDLAGLDLSEINGIAVTRGPGTFTGLRIGISCVKGLAAALGKPVVGVSGLEALAVQCCDSEHLVCPLIDARKGEVYFSRYSVQGRLLKREIDESVLPPDRAVSNIDEPLLLVGSGARLYRDTLIKILGQRAFFARPFQNVIRASTVAYLSMPRFAQNDTDEVATFVPQYIRKSDAELHIKSDR